MGKNVLRGLTLSLTLVAAILMAPLTAAAAPYAALVMDARTGQVLYAKDADRRLHPASLTKMMTLYLTIEAVKKGKLRLDQKVRISRHAASQPPSKIGMRPGQMVTIRDLIRAAAVKSANDAAVALAEAVSGSEEAFARLMTAKAKTFGMTNTTFRNANGLTEEGHLSTARDMAIMGRRLFYDHPAYYNIFSRKTTRTMGKTVHATNRRLLSSYAGADGIKTGYTRAAGFNLVASAHRGDKRVIAVVFGGRSSRSRNHKIAELLDLGFRKSPREAPIIRPSTVRVAAAKEAPLPDDKPDAPKTLLARSMETIGEAIVTPAAASERAPMSRSRYAPRIVSLPKLRPAKGGEWSVQVGAYSHPANAEARIATARSFGLAPLARASAQVVTQDDKLYRARFTGLSEAEARAACAAIKRKGHGGCAPVSPQS